jgi:hypothetical protein
MSGRWRLVLGVLGWALAAYGVLALGSLPGDFGHSLCGPWGCLPPLQALAAMHLFWGLLLLPLVVWGLAKGQPGQLRFVGGLLVLASGLGIVVVAGWDLWSWLPAMPPELRGYWARRALYTVVTLSDVPLVQVLLAGAVCWSAGLRRAHGPVNYQ